MEIIEDNDIFKREGEFASSEEIITFKLPEERKYEKRQHDWYITVALEKAKKVKIDRHLLTADLILSYRWAIREGFNHMLDPSLKDRYDHPKNRNTVEGIKSYIQRIKKASDKEMSNI